MTKHTVRQIGQALEALALGLPPAFMVAVSVFSDGQWAERRFIILAIIVGYGLLGALAGWLFSSWRSALWVSLPALPALVVFGENVMLGLAYLAMIAGFASLGAAAGSQLRIRRG